MEHDDTAVDVHQRRCDEFCALRGRYDHARIAHQRLIVDYDILRHAHGLPHVSIVSYAYRFVWIDGVRHPVLIAPIQGGQEEPLDRRLLLDLEVEAQPETLSTARRTVRAALRQTGIGRDVARDLEMAVGEALNNAYQHGYRGDIGKVGIRVFFTADAVTITVSDDGSATVAPEPRRPKQGRARGSGLYLIQRLVDDVDIFVNPSGHGLTVRMTVPIVRRGFH